jgi:O-antigen/teichoic acid export membrane protein
MVEIDESPRRHVANRHGMTGGRIYLLLDQAVFSGTNFILTVILARTYSAAEFGSYGIGLSIAFIVQFVQRNVYIVSYSLMSRRVASRLSPGIVAEHLIVAGGAVLLAALATGVVAATRTGQAGLDIAVSTLVCTVIYFQVDFDRAVQVKRGSYRGALALSLAYLAIVVAMAVLAKQIHISFPVFMTLLGLVCTLKFLWLCVLRVRPHWAWGLRLLARDWRRYGTVAVIQSASYAGGQHLPLMILAALSGSAQVGGLIAMRSLIQPLMLVIRSFDAADKNRFRLVSSGRTAGARRVFWFTMLVYSGIGLSAVMVLAIFQNQIIAIVYHGKYTGLGGIMIAWAIYAALLGLTFPIQSLTYLLHRQRQLTAWIIASGSIGIVLAAILCGRYGIWGAMSATVISMAINVVGGLLVSHDIILGRGDAPLPKELSLGRSID